MIDRVGREDGAQLSAEVQKRFASIAEKTFFESQKFVLEKLKSISEGAQKSVSTSGD